MTDVLRSIRAVLIWIFLILIPVQFYLAGHGAMEGAHAADKNVPVMSTAWDPHVAIGTIMSLIAVLILLVTFAARPGRRPLIFTGAFFVAMLIQFFLPFLNDSASTRWLAALHGVNALVVTGLAIGLAVRSRADLPVVGERLETAPTDVTA
jgi:hypothetical protein